MSTPNISVKKAKNGWVISYWRKDKEIIYVYDSLEDALKEIQGIISVAEEDSSEPKVAEEEK